MRCMCVSPRLSSSFFFSRCLFFKKALSYLQTLTADIDRRNLEINLLRFADVATPFLLDLGQLHVNVPSVMCIVGKSGGAGVRATHVCIVDDQLSEVVSLCFHIKKKKKAP